MPRLIDSEDRTQSVVAAVNAVLVSDGPWGLSLRAIGKTAGLSPSSLLHHYGDREHLLRVSAHRTGKVRMDRIGFWWGFSGATAFLPEDEDQLETERAWQQWLVLARSAEWMQNTVDHHRATELAMLAKALRLTRDDPHTLVVRALLDGLAGGLCDPLNPLDVAQARQLLAQTLPLLTSEATDAAQTAQPGQASA